MRFPAAFFSLLGLTSLAPVLRQWPWLWLAPLSGYFTIVLLIPSLRRSIFWLRAGNLSFLRFAVTAAIIVLSSTALVLYHALFRPDVTALGTLLPVQVLGGVFLAGILFPLLNATLEELVFRGVLFDAVEAEWGWRAAVGVTALTFGVAHVSGYPPGWLGAILAGIYGVALGLLRVWVRGLVLPIIAHVAADATIYGILVYSGAV